MNIERLKRQRLRRKKRVRKKVFGFPDKPRLTVYKSNKYIYAQLIDDTKGKVLCSASTIQKDLRHLKPNKEGAKAVGEKMGKQIKELGIEKIVFDRNGYKYHGILKELADAVRAYEVKF